MTVLVVASVVGVGTGLWLVVTGWSPRPVAVTTEPEVNARPRAAASVFTKERAARAGGAAALVFVVSGWPAAAVAGGLLGWFAPELFASRASRDAALARTEAIASWTEMLRDTIASSHGLEAAIATTAPVAPDAIRPEVEQLARSLKHASLPDALRRFAVDVAHPISDLVVASLTVAANGAVRDLAELLGMLADSARDEAAMQLRVEASRARMRTAVRVISGVTVVTAVGLVVLNRSYVEVYATITGQVVLVGIAAAWGTALWWLASMSRFQQPERFLIAAAEGTLR